MIALAKAIDKRVLSTATGENISRFCEEYKDQVYWAVEMNKTEGK